MTDATPSLPHVDTEVPNSARIWNYFLGGKDNYPVDQKLGEYIKQKYPAVCNIALASRGFLHRVVRHLVEKEGIRQFIDIGTGLPTAENTHEVAQRYNPECRIVYVDNDPLVLLHAQALLTSSAEGATAYAQADVRNPDAVLRSAAETLDFDKPIALTLLSMLGHIEPDEAAELVQHYTSRLPRGSFLATCDSINAPEMVEANNAYTASGAMPYHLRTEEQLAATAAGLEILPPGVGPINEWRPDRELEPTLQWGLVARKN
ncbi:SAM-dependent methyltransferase [Streptomyces sp. SBT349]|uniref:SAM-dependent methyltransferase n=1 Tax=Streptomyces sp. SBT349 TaxID=1580539 RepID=UPI00066B72BA|nr:SAM-dependent methyltransferase [Streptomyces sp. SBT349]